MEVRLDDLSGPQVRRLLEEHVRDMLELSPRESMHALDVDGLRRPDITFWTVWSAESLMGCGALREIAPTHGEIKSMRTSPAHRRQGVARTMLAHIIAEGTKRRYHRLSLETGSMQAFEPAQKLYEGFGFTYCPPFGDYVEDPNSVFMTRVL